MDDMLDGSAGQTANSRGTHRPTLPPTWLKDKAQRCFDMAAERDHHQQLGDVALKAAAGPRVIWSNSSYVNHDIRGKARTASENRSLNSVEWFQPPGPLIGVSA